MKNKLLEGNFRKKFWHYNLNLIILGIFLIFYFIPFVSANFVCGQVKDSAENVSAIWDKVSVYYPNFPEDVSNCYVSPAENKYCCDPEEILVKKWNIGNQISAEIYDPELGYFSGPVSLIISGEGYDVFPVMQLKKVINIHQPYKKLYVMNNSDMFFNISFLEPFFNISLKQNNTLKFSCPDCQNITQDFNAYFGMNNFFIQANNGLKEFNETLNFAVLSSIDFNRSFECKKCGGKKIGSNKIVNVSLEINLSDFVKGMVLKEFVPKDFEILDTGEGIIRNYSESYNLIYWNISGKQIQENYTLKSPNLWFFPRKYVFHTELENEVINDDVVLVKWLFGFFPKEKEFIVKTIKQKKQSRIFPGKPLVIHLNKKYVKRVAVFVENKTKNAEFSLLDASLTKKPENYIAYYKFDTNLEKENIEEIYLEFEIDKSFLKQKQFSNISLLVYDKEDLNSFREKTLKIIKENNKKILYAAHLNASDGIAIFGVKNKKNLFERIFNFFD